MLLAIALAIGVWFYGVPEFGPPPPLTGQIERIIIDKSDRRMVVYQHGLPVRSYAIALGFAPDGAKTVQGDGKTPEGRFTIDRRNPASAYHLSLGLDYPRPQDLERARAMGRSAGGDIFIHGQPNKMPKGYMMRGDWTAGCIALTNSQIRELWDTAPIGTEVVIRP